MKVLGHVFAKTVEAAAECGKERYPQLGRLFNQSWLLKEERLNSLLMLVGLVR